MSPRFGFVLGTGRCGSTLLHEMLVRHPDAGFISNIDDRLSRLHLTGRWNRSLYRHTPPSLTRKRRPRYGPSEAYRLFDEQVAPVISMPFRDLRADDVTPWLETRFRHVFESRSVAQRAPVFLHKFTGWPRAAFIHAIFPDARFVNVIRDGRAVASSWLQMPWWLGYRGPWAWPWGPLPEAYAAEWEASDHSFVVLAGLAWKILIDAYDAARELVPPTQWLDVRYEDVLADPANQLVVIRQFLGLPKNRDFDASLERYEFDVSRTDAYRHQLDARSLRQLEASLAGHLTRYRYPVGPEPPQPSPGSR